MLLFEIVVVFFILSKQCLAEEVSNYHLPCDYRCLNGKLEKNKSYVPIPNGCGSDGLMINFKHTKFSQFDQCCNKHDQCYGKCASSKIKCDFDFKACLKNVCQSVDSISKKSCIFNGKMMYGLVKIFGCDNFIKTQTKACLCT